MALPNGFFRYPHEFVEAVEPFRQAFQAQPDVQRAMESMVARIMDRDRALEDYLTQVRFSVGGVRPPGYIVAASDSQDKFKAAADFVGDGVADQVAIQAAIDALVADPTTLFQGVVYLAPGIYRTTASIDLKGQTLAGASGQPKDAAISRSNNGPVIQDGANQYNGFSLVDLNIVAQDSPAILVNNASSFAPIIRIINCSVGGVGGTATGNGHIDIEAANGTCSLILVDCNLSNGGSATPVVYANGANSSSSEQSRVHGCTLNGGGLYLPGGTGVSVIGNNINNGSFGHGVSLTSAATANLVMNNIISSFPSGNGINMNVTTENQIINNRISSWGTDGISITTGTRDNVMNNFLSGSGTTGIHIVSGTDIVVAHNDLLQVSSTRFTDGGTNTIVYAGNRPLAGSVSPGGPAGGFLAGTYPNPIFSATAFTGDGSALTAAHADHKHDFGTSPSGPQGQADNDVLFWMSITMGGIH